MRRSYLLLLFISILITVSVNARSVSVDAVEGTWDDGGTVKIWPDCDVSFYIRLENNSGAAASGLTNGFRVYGPSTFTPITGEVILDGFEDLFNLGFFIYTFSDDGLGADTIGFSGASMGTDALHVGFNEVVYKLTTGGVQEGETLCLDSSYYPPTGTWLWAPGDAPSWDGPHCFLAESPDCLPAYIENWVDTLTFYSCDTLSYQFIGVNPWAKCKINTKKSGSGFEFKLWEGPGILDSITGEWLYYAGSSVILTNQTLHYGIYSVPYCRGTEYTTVLKLLDSIKPGDLNQSCTVDVGDLVFLVTFMFDNGEPPVVMEDADINGDGLYDISDLVYFVNYMFNDGPPPVE